MKKTIEIINTLNASKKEIIIEKVKIAKKERTEKVNAFKSLELDTLVSDINTQACKDTLSVINSVLALESDLKNERKDIENETLKQAMFKVDTLAVNTLKAMLKPIKKDMKTLKNALILRDLDSFNMVAYKWYGFKLTRKNFNKVATMNVLTIEKSDTYFFNQFNGMLTSALELSNNYSKNFDTKTIKNVYNNVSVVISDIDLLSESIQYDNLISIVSLTSYKNKLVKTNYLSDITLLSKALKEVVVLTTEENDALNDYLNPTTEEKAD